MRSSSLNSFWPKRYLAPNLLFTSLVTFLAIIYGFAFSWPLRKIVEEVSNNVLSLFWATVIIFLFLLFLLFDWFLSTLVLLRYRSSPRLHTYVFPVVTVPFIGMSLYFTLSGYLHGSTMLMIAGFQSFFVFILLVFVYDATLYPKLIEQENFLSEYFGLFHVIVLLKILFTLTLLPTMFLMFINKTDYLVKCNTILYALYFMFKVTVDYKLIRTIIHTPNSSKPSLDEGQKEKT